MNFEILLTILTDLNSYFIPKLSIILVQSAYFPSNASLVQEVSWYNTFLCFLQDFEKDEGIYVLTDKNYDEGVKHFKYLLVYFYAPWCGHCKAFGPELVKAAQQLKEKDSPIKFAKVNGPEEEELLKKMHVTGKSLIPKEK